MYANDTTLAKYIWELKSKRIKIPTLKWSIMKNVPDYSNITKNCLLYLHEKFKFLNYPTTLALRKKCPNMELFLVRIFLHSDWIRRDTEYLSVFSSNVGKYGPEKTPYLGTFQAVSDFSINVQNSFWNVLIPTNFYFQNIKLMIDIPEEFCFRIDSQYPRKNFCILRNCAS